MKFITPLSLLLLLFSITACQSDTRRIDKEQEYIRDSIKVVQALDKHIYKRFGKRDLEYFIERDLTRKSNIEQFDKLKHQKDSTDVLHFYSGAPYPRSYKIFYSISQNKCYSHRRNKGNSANSYSWHMPNIFKFKYKQQQSEYTLLNTYMTNESDDFFIDNSLIDFNLSSNFSRILEDYLNDRYSNTLINRKDFVEIFTQFAKVFKDTSKKEFIKNLSKRKYVDTYYGYGNNPLESIKNIERKWSIGVQDVLNEKDAIFVYINNCYYKLFINQIAENKYSYKVRFTCLPHRIEYR